MKKRVSIRYRRTNRWTDRCASSWVTSVRVDPCGNGAARGGDFTPPRPGPSDIGRATAAIEALSGGYAQQGLSSLVGLVAESQECLRKESRTALSLGEKRHTRTELEVVWVAEDLV